MIAFPNVKINLGLNVTSKRPDGYHNIESVFYPVPFRDAVEILPSKEFKFNSYGIEVTDNPNDNLVVKVYKLMKETYSLPEAEIALLKGIPAGTGLGGGSSDAAFTIKLLNDVFDLKLTNERLAEFASQVGSDCPFFIENKPAFVSGRGEVIQPIDLDLKGFYITLVLPNIHISTQEAYANIRPEIPEISPQEVVKRAMVEWQVLLKNDFEDYAFSQYPELHDIKLKLYVAGAAYASMSGSGSAIYAISEDKLELKDTFRTLKVWQGRL